MKPRPLSRIAVTDEYIDHVRRDLLATTELSFKLLEEFNNHPLALAATRAFSPASLGKGYLRAMGIKPILERQPNFPKQYLGHAQTAFFWRANQRAHSQGGLPGGLHGFSIDVFHGEQPYVSLAVCYRR